MKSIVFHTLGKSYILISVFVPLLLISCTQEYTRYYQSHFGKPTQESNHIISGEFQFLDAEIFFLPEKGVKSALINDINSAEQRIWIEIYSWTDRDILDAVLRAHRRGVDVRVVLEPSVYGTPYINKSTYNKLHSRDIPVVYADTDRFTFTHAKFFIIDDAFYISTGNLTQSFFTKNRDIIFRSKSIEVHSFLSELFLRDFSQLGTKDLEPFPESLVLSPENSREKIISLITSTKTSLIIYTQTLQDSEILSQLDALSANHIDVQVCTAKNEDTASQNTSFLWNRITHIYPHLKIILVDSESIFIGSQNLTANSLDNNREVGIIIRSNTSLFEKLMRIYREDCLR